ncbi:hypothetical protein [Myxococcus qinghaiensis]|uniref:hypothetical protein n=1 Tax=Myxococcus qinghaiensis TaxID=2906758 RepID=UPI0020A6FB16|nr:hypothetical protein [Myxococcus qinghaiensis]MCP3166827.1 hypothetical protein [Myxococcus qinghaiensis]
MANGQRRGSGPGRSEETRIAPEEDEDATRDIPAAYRPEETRLAPPEPAPSETRIGPLDEQAEIITDVRKGQSAEARGGRAATARPPEPRGGGRGASDDRSGRGQEVILTEARGAGRGQEVIQTEARGTGRGQEVIQTEARGTGRGPSGRGQEVIATEARGASRGATGARGRGPDVSAMDDDDEDTSAAAVKGGDEEYQLFTTGERRDEDLLPFATELRGSGAPAVPATELRPPAPPVLRPEKGKAPGSPKPPPPAKGTGWLSKGGEKPPSPGLTAGVVRLSPLEPAAGKVAAAAEDGPALRTMFANHSALLAEQLRDALGKKMYGRGPHRVLRIDDPEGPSTGGGKQARQSISLVPRKGTGPSVVCGWVDVSKREAQLRGFEGVAKRYEAHHGEPLELATEEYERFLHDVEDVLVKAVIKVRLIVPEEQAGAGLAAPAARAPARGGVPMILVLLLMGAAFALGLFVGRTPG